MKQSANSHKIEGELGYFRLVDWWIATFTQEERSYIETIYQPLGSEPNSKPLTHGQVTAHSGTATGLLSGLATWFRKPGDYLIACKVLQKAEKLGNLNVLDLHFTYQAMIEIHYRMRNDDETAFDRAVDACEKQILLAPKAAKAFMRDPYMPNLPAHVGYKQLAIIREKQKDYDGAIQLCCRAKEQGWDGDWEKRIERYTAKASKMAK